MWANYPYLHNGSVPTLWHLLGPASERPAVFEVMAARRFDRERVGQPLHASEATRGLSETALLRRFRDDRDWFVVTRPGSGNGGHDFWNRIRTDERRRALIEYLKTLVRGAASRVVRIPASDAMRSMFATSILVACAALAKLDAASLPNQTTFISSARMNAATPHSPRAGFPSTAR